MEDQVEEIKRKINIVDVIGAYVELKKAGRHHKGLCPFHAERTPSFSVSEEMGFYKCFGCGKGGDAFSFLMEIEGIDFREALTRMAEKAGIELRVVRSEESDEKKEMLDVMNLATEYFHYVLMETPAGEEARKYLTERKINKKLWETFKLGFALPSWEGLVKFLIEKKKYKGELLEKVGLVAQGRTGWYDRFRGRVMFPLQDAGGKVVGFSGRILPSLATDKEPKYVNSPETVLYHKGRMLYGFFQAKQTIREKKRVVVVEGQMDEISSFGAGVTETVAVGGTALTEDQVEMVARLAETVIFALDADEAGLIAMKRSVEIAEKRGLKVKMVNIIGGKDPDEIARSEPATWKKMVEEAVEVYEFIFEKAIAKYGAESVDAVSKVSEEVLPYLAKIQNEVVKEAWMRRLSEKLGVEKETVMKEMNRISRKNVVVNKKEEVDEKKEESGIEKKMKSLVGKMCVVNGKGEKLREIIKGVDFADFGAVGKVIVWMVEGQRVGWGLEKIVMEAPKELVAIIQEAVLEVDEEKLDEKNVILMAVEVVRELVKERRDVLTRKVAEAEKTGFDSEVGKWMMEVQELNKKEREVVKYLY